MKVDILDYLHRLFMRLKGGVLFVFILIITLASLTSNSAFGEGPVAVVETPVRVFFDNETKSFTATQNTVEGALRQGEISVGKYDVSEPSLNTFLTGKETNIKITRALPVLISDDGQQMLAFSAYSAAGDIFKQLNFPIYPEDRVDSNLILDPVDENAAGQKISITRAPVYTIEFDGTEKVVRSWDKTVDEVIGASGIPLAPKDQLNPARGSLLTPGQRIVITRIAEEDIDESETVSFDTIYKIDPSLGLTGKRVAQEGINGKIIKTYHAIYKNGVETSRWLTGTKIVQQVQNRVVYRGAEIGRANFGTIYSGMTTAYKGKRGQKLLITNLNNGKQVIVTVVDYGPVNALLDLSVPAFNALGGNTFNGYMTNIAVQLAE